MAAPSVARIDRTSSIENEPRTLNIHQIQFAREAAAAALYVIKTRSIEEAFQIFTQGMEPVRRVAEFELGEAREECPSDPEFECSCCFYSLKSIKHQLKDVLSAPF
uniref:Uncharacterized protein n=1 Tax=Opuntia streptacantha TaxID=393608 RepID=A0A7C8ZS42_OPUST